MVLGEFLLLILVGTLLVLFANALHFQLVFDWLALSKTGGNVEYFHKYNHIIPHR